MSKKDYVLIAATIRASLEEREISLDGAQNIAGRLAAEMVRENPRFDRARFLKACGVQ